MGAWVVVVGCGGGGCCGSIFFFLAMGFDFEMGIDCDGGGQFYLCVKRERDKEEDRELLWVKRETMRKRDKESEMNKKVKQC